jgi:hypothetical protein
MTLHRRIIRSLSSADDPSLRSICRQAAQARLKSAMDFISSLRPEHLQSFWYSASSYNFALVGTFISLLWATSTTKPEADMYKKSLEEYRWVLRLSSKSADFLERAIGILGSSTGVLVKAIPEYPDAEGILGRHLRRARHGYTVLSRNHSHGNSVAYLSESEMQDGTSPNDLVEETPSDSGRGSRGWNVDHVWFSGLYEGESGLEQGCGEDDVSNAYLGLNGVPVDFEYG